MRRERDGRSRDVGAEEARVERGRAGRADEIRLTFFRKDESQAQIDGIHVGQTLVMEPVLADQALEHNGIGPLVVVESMAHAVDVGKVLVVHVVLVLLGPDNRFSSSCTARGCSWRPTVATKVSPPPYGAHVVVGVASHSACLAHSNPLGGGRGRGAGEARVDHLGLVPLGVRASVQGRVCQQCLCLHVGHLFRRQHAIHRPMFGVSERGGVRRMREKFSVVWVL